MQASVYDLLTTSPHVPPETRFSAADFRVYRAGYSWGVVMALRVMQAAEERHKMHARTRRLDARRVKL